MPRDSRFFRQLRSVLAFKPITPLRAMHRISWRNERGHLLEVIPYRRHRSSNRSGYFLCTRHFEALKHLDDRLLYGTTALRCRIQRIFQRVDIGAVGFQTAFFNKSLGHDTNIIGIKVQAVANVMHARFTLLFYKEEQRLFMLG